ncbi:ComEC/Rec2 family competence protein [Oceanirhabdus sp. W0125-5]|uniref:ComEC/Rec2 family competence protein n=1 Tax=Oceanirhabdus sp. W0125-5 TaxID=2999116 RepID=UPI0022F2AC6B|nr:hypothetical protein [Oceanirhabdus sp. W0125-5]WBW98093.1 hypothetical protein OW730_04825 [Oceanirhabdus sp. W0125-5]
MNESSPLRIAFLDVGHGDTIVISTVENNITRAIIIDCNDAIKTKNYILEAGIQVVDYIVITHLHRDHYKGINTLIDLLIRNDIEIRNVCWEKDRYLRSDEEQVGKYNLFTRRLNQYHINKKIKYVPKRFDNDNYRRLDNECIEEFSCQIIYPNSFVANYWDDSNINNTSAVVQIQYNGFKIILPGDLEGEGWKMLVSDIKNLKCDILKMPHHGGYFNGTGNALSTGEVIDCTSPKFAIISTGQNDKYNHPYKETIQYLASKNINIICTEVTDLCAKDRLDKKECIMAQLGKTYKLGEKKCPCAGDIIFEIDDDIKLIPNYKILNNIRSNFNNRLCMDIKK